MSTVLVTGATGFVGRHALQALLRSGQEVHAVARTPPAGAAEVSWHSADLLEPGAAERVVAAARPSHLLHLAWYAEHGRYWTAPENVQWVEATLALFRAFAAQGGERAVMAGTSAEYDWSHGFCSEHVTPRRPATLYGVAKDAAHRVVRLGGRAGRRRAGLGARLLPLRAARASRAPRAQRGASARCEGRPAPVSSGAQVRDFMHVEDVADGFAALLGSDVAGPVNVASGDPVRIRDIVAAIGELAGRPDLPRLGELPDRPGDPPLLVADVRRLRDEVGFVPRHSLVDGLRDTLEWWRERL